MEIRLAPVGLRKFAEPFRMREDYYMIHLEQVRELFKSQFGPSPEKGFNQFMITHGVSISCRHVSKDARYEVTRNAYVGRDQYDRNIRYISNTQFRSRVLLI